MLPALHVCTFATERTKGFDQLIDSCKRYGITLDIIGMGASFRGYADKLIQVQDYLKTLPGQDVVLYVDAYDVLFLSDADTILRKFLKMKASFVIGAGRDCFPYAELASEFSHSPTSFNYINGGSYIGYVDFIRNIFDEISPIPPNADDQGLLIQYYVTHKDKFVFDHNCELFLPLNFVMKEEVVIDKEARVVRCTTTKSTPCIVHGNGFGRTIYQQIYDELFATNKSYTEHLAALELELREHLERISQLWKNVGRLFELALAYAKGDFDMIPAGLQQIIFERQLTVETLNLSHIPLKRSAVQAIKNFSHLKELDLSYCDLDEDIVETLGSLQNLAILDVSGNNKIGAKAVARMLELQLPLTSFKCKHYLDVKNQDLQHIVRLPIQILYLHFSEDLTEEGQRMLSSMPTLKRVHLVGDANFTNKGLELACRLPLQSITFRHSQIRDEDLLCITIPLQQLHFIACDGITDRAIEYLSEIVPLKFTLISLTFEGCKNITDGGLKKLVSLSLESLQVIACPEITNKGLEFLHTLKLQILVLSDRLNPQKLHVTYFPPEFSEHPIEFTH